jgi:hypothetical protein
LHGSLWQALMFGISKKAIGITENNRRKRRYEK